MAKGHFRKQRHVVRLKNGRGIPASSLKQVAKIARREEVELVETETGDQAVQDILTIYKSYTPEPDPPGLDTWPCCPMCGEYLDDDGECLAVKDGYANHGPLVKERRKRK